MKDLAESLREVTVTGTQEVVAMSVADNGEVLKAFITSIYSQKEKTVVRELMSNAFDSMIAAGKGDEEIEVYLPTSLDPCFIVRDFGEGMTHDFVMKLYSSLGESTKRQTNAQTGMYGIGSKSPLSITDTFTLRCFDKPGWNGAPHMVGEYDLNELGRIRLYTIFIDENNVPRIGHTFDVLPREGDRGELGGCEVKVPIGPDKRRALLEGVASQHFCWFDKPVKFDGALDEVESSFFKNIVKISDDLYLADRGDSSSSTRSRTHGSGWSLYARQGSAVYPITESEVTAQLSAEIIQSIRTLSGDSNERHILLEIPIGTIRATLAREALQYTPEGLKNLCACITDTFTKFGLVLAGHIGNSRTYPDALIKLAEGMIDDPKERKRIPRLKFLSGLLPLCHANINNNYDDYHATLPDVTVRRPKIDSIGFPVKDPATGETLFEDVIERPAKLSPKLSKQMELAHFPEGKVLLHSGEIKRRYSDLETSFNSPSSTVTFRTPTIAYVIPSFLRKWQERLTAHLKATFSMDEFPKEGDELKVVVVRCGKKNLEGAVAALREHGVLFRHFGVDDMPDIAADVSEGRAYSKTSVYQWSNSSKHWNETKVEPDYLQRAFYITRVGIAHECYSKHPTQMWTRRPIKAKFGNYDMEQLINAARRLGFLDSTTPIYRVTEKQAQSIAESAPAWVHLPTFLAERVLNEPTSAKYKPFLRSALASARSNDWALTNYTTRVMRTNVFSGAVEKEIFSAFYSMCKADPTFLYNVAVRWNDATTRESFSADDNRLADVKTALFGSRDIDDGEVNSDPYDMIATTFQERYSFPLKIMMMGRSEGRPYDPEWVHVKMYVDAFLNHLAAGGPYPAPTDVDLVLPLVDEFTTKLDKIHAELYLVESDDTIIDEPSLTLEEEAA